MNQNIYYISIKSTSLAHYMGKALILPNRFYRNKPSDIQNIDEDYIILSKNKFLNNSNCSIEIILDNQEVKNLINFNKNKIYFSSNPIPTSRIIKIYFLDEIEKSQIIYHIHKTKTVFISEELTKVINENNLSIDMSNIKHYQYNERLEKKIKTYDNILGGLAFVKYTTEGEISKNYLSIRSYFNKNMQNKVKNRFDKYDGAFKKIGNWKKFYNEITDKDVEQCQKEENIKLEKSNGIFKYELLSEESMKSLTYKLAILSLYGNNSNKRKKIEDLLYDLKNNKIPKSKIEGISLIFGINNGYSSFYNIYDKKKVKFEMNRDDYYTIESVFQYVINNKKDNRQFDYIDKIFTNENILINLEKEDNFELIFDLNLDTNSEIEEATQDKSKDSKFEEFQKFRDIINKKITQQDKKIEELEEEIKKLKNENSKIKSFNLDEEKEKINIEKDLEELLLKDLKKIAREKKIKGRSSMNKAKLYEVIKENEYYK